MMFWNKIKTIFKDSLVLCSTLIQVRRESFLMGIYGINISRRKRSFVDYSTFVKGMVSADKDKIKL